MDKKIVSISTKIGLNLGVGVFLTAAILIAISTFSFRNNSINAAKEQAVATAKEFAARIKVPMEEALNASASFANALSAAGTGINEFKLDRKQAELMAAKILMSNNAFLGFTLAYEPNAFDGNDSQFINSPNSDVTGRFISYLTKDGAGKYVIEALVDYETAEAGPWYWIPKQTRKDAINGPVLYPVQGVDMLMVSYMTPILKQGQFVGVTGIDISIDFIQEMANTAEIFEGNGEIQIISNSELIAASTINKNSINRSLREVNPSGYQFQSDLIKNGREAIKIEDGELQIYVPISIGKTDTPWQIQLSVPLSYITQEATTGMWRLLAIGIALTALSIVVINFFVNRLIKPLSSISEIANNIAQGDLSPIKAVKVSNDEVGMVYTAFKSMVENLRGIVENIITGADSISGASSQMSSASQQLSQGASEQASSAEEVSSSMEEMAANIQQNTDNAQEADKISQKVQDGVQKVGAAAGDSLSSIKNIAEKIGIINDIAFQTNILALNAAVEAARAGEQGRGFAVVAAEVRKLAERSKIAADEIVALASKSVNITETASDLMGNLIPEIEKTAKLVQEIAAASMEQSTGAEQVNSAIQQLNQVTQQNAAASEELATSSEELYSQADQLKEIISYFKL